MSCSRPPPSALTGKSQFVGRGLGKDRQRDYCPTSGRREIDHIITPKTRFRRYAPDSVTFTQATSSSIGEVATGDQIRARGQTTGDGLKMTADEVVFGTFWTKGGQITEIDPHTGEITIQEVGTKKPLVVKLTAESKLKMLPNMKMAQAPADVLTAAHQ